MLGSSEYAVEHVFRFNSVTTDAVIFTYSIGLGLMTLYMFWSERIFLWVLSRI